jgi:formylglycine-generating enzyme required for sulfatase activity
MSHIFISYSKKDTRSLAFALADALNALPGVTAWVDRSLKAGPAWEAQIQTEILKCDVFVVLYSPDINRHLRGEPESYVLTEISYAKYTLHKLIIPVMAQKTDPPLSLTRAHYIDFTVPGLSVIDLVERICAEIGIPMSASPVVPTGGTTPASSAKPRRSRSLDLLPAPFAWVKIPAGRVTLEEGGYVPKGGQTFDVPAFQIAKYPVTNAQYKLFVDAGGYQDRQWWTDAGWLRRESVGWTEPRYWNDKQWNGDDYPVVGVSWYEAVAFCRWLSARTGKAITLPTEQQWQRAAQGDDERTYPWGNTWEDGRCNHSVGKDWQKNSTTPVRQFEGKGKGNSPFGVVDMAGNTWEWCLTDYADSAAGIRDKAEHRVLRGGSWVSSITIDFRTRFRLKHVPYDGGYYWGFRLARSS